MSTPLDASPMDGPQGAPFDQPGFHLQASRGTGVISGMIALMIFSSIFVGARLLSRRLARAGFWWDDILVVVALLFAFGGPVCNIVAVRSSGFGKHIYVLGDKTSEDLTETFRILYVFQLMFCLATGTVKLCTLAFYRRIFPIKEINYILLLITFLVVSFILATVTISIFQCTPIHKFWDKDTLGHCIDPAQNLAISGALNTTLDFIIVALPVPLLWQLRTSRRQKLILTGIFVGAGFVCVVSIIRLIVFTEIDPDDITWNNVPVTIWSAVEPCAGVICACIPSLRPLISVLFHQDRSIYRISQSQQIAKPIPSHTNFANGGTSSLKTRISNPIPIPSTVIASKIGIQQAPLWHISRVKKEKEPMEVEVVHNHPPIPSYPSLHAGGYSRDNLVPSAGTKITLHADSPRFHEGKEAMDMRIVEEELEQKLGEDEDEGNEVPVPPGNIRVRTDIRLSWRDREKLDYRFRIF